MDYSTKTLAQGCFGKIYQQKFGDAWAAMKKVPVRFISEKDLQRECEVYNNARHPNVVRLLGKPWIDDYKWHIPMEFIFGEDLETTIFESANSKIQLTPAVKATIIIGMCDGLHHLHSKDIIHQDLKPDNIMVEHQTHRAVIIDLGLAKFSKDGLNSAQNLGNEAYSAPEILRSKGVRDKQSDVWAMGKIIAELCAGTRLKTQYLCASKIQETLKTDQTYCTPVSKMVETNPDYRVTMDDILPEIKEAASASKRESQPRDITFTQGNQMRGNTTAALNSDDWRAGSALLINSGPRNLTVMQRNEMRGNGFPEMRGSLFASSMDMRDGTVTQNYAMMGNAVDELMPNIRAQQMDIRDEIQRHHMMVKQSLGLPISPMLNVQHEPLQQLGMGRGGVFPFTGDGVINQMSKMSMTGEIKQISGAQICFQRLKSLKIGRRHFKVRHPNVVKLLGDPWVEDYKWHIPMEFIFGEDLETTIFESANSKIQLTPAVKATIIIGMCDGLHHLHTKDIIHQDLKPDNIMVEHQTHRAVIIDLGLAKFSKDGLNSAQNLGNEAYSAPEILRSGEVRDKQSDVWAMGKIIAELCAGTRLKTQYLCASKIQETLKTDQTYCTPVSKMVETNPEYRVTMDDILPEIKEAASASKRDSKPRDTNVTSLGNEKRGNTSAALNSNDWRAGSALLINSGPRNLTVMQRNEMRGNGFPEMRGSLFASSMDMRDGTVTQNYAMMGNAVDELMPNIRTSPLAQHMDLRDEIQRHHMMVKQSLGLPISPMLNVQHEPLQQLGMGRGGVFPFTGDGVINQMSQMSMTGEVRQSFSEQKVAMNYKKVESSGGTSFSYNKVQMSKHISK
nr:uncharacterized protein LOC129449211 [Misgurnus anguillicaudatus]